MAVRALSGWARNRVRAEVAGGVAAPLRFASANNQFPNAVATFNLGTGCAQTDLLVNTSHTIGQDMPSIVLGATQQWLKFATGVSNVGNSVTIMEMSVVYNGAVVAVTSGGLTTWTIADTTNWQSDAIPAASFAGALKISKGTVAKIKVRYRSNAPTTDKYPLGHGGIAGVDQIIYLDPAKITITTGVMATGQFNYSFKNWAITSATAVGTVVTVVMPDTSVLQSGSKYTITGATGSGAALNYNAVKVPVNVVDATTATYDVSLATPVLGAPTSTATGSLQFNAINGIDLNLGNNLIPVFVLGYHSKPSIVMPGDSKTYGTGDTVPATGVIGVSRVLFTDATLSPTVQASGLNCGCPSGYALETYTATASGVVANFEYWYTLANYAIVGYGTNNLSSANQTTMYGRLRAKGIAQIIQRSLTPRTATLNSDPVTVTALTSAGTTAVTGTMADTSGLIEGQSYPISGASPAAYNGTFAIHIVDGTTFSYTALSIPGSSPATGTLVLDDQWRTTQYQTIAAGWGISGTADTFETFLRGNVASDFVYYQSTGERSNATLGTTGYWKWGANGTIKWMTGDGLHEGGTAGFGYEQNLGTAGTITTLGGGTVSQSLRAYVGTLT